MFDYSDVFLAKLVAGLRRFTEIINQPFQVVIESNI